MDHHVQPSQIRVVAAAMRRQADYWNDDADNGLRRLADRYEVLASRMDGRGRRARRGPWLGGAPETASRTLPARIAARPGGAARNGSTIGR